MSFKPLDFLKVAVESRNISNIRAAISSYITKNPGNKGMELNEVLKYISNNQLDSQLWEKHVVRSDETQNKDQWSKDYFRLIRSNLRSNFSMNRMKHILEVGEYLYKDEVEQKKEIRTNNVTNSNKIDRKIDNSKGDKIGFGEKLVLATKFLFTDDYRIAKKSNGPDRRRVNRR